VLLTVGSKTNKKKAKQNNCKVSMLWPNCSYKFALAKLCMTTMNI